jgi:diaminohydroxyphosphoribosylaminopyrimidine deaminase/5-amino-6-(5-phosphoribosylamino)uracil reductase
MRAALREALRWEGATSPNPVVGAVVVSKNRILGRGAHRKAGTPHAEVEALASLARPEQAHGATLYVTLEPCCTWGRTPPCTEAILRAGITKVVVGTGDPNPRHAGRGLDWLRERGVAVETGVLERECQEANRAFFKRMRTGRPWVIAKVALSRDERLTLPPGEGRWLTGLPARRDAHRLRARVDAILVGAGTVRADDPQLTIRGVRSALGRPQPWRIVLASEPAALPASARLFTDEHRDRTVVYSGKTPGQVLDDLGARLGVNSVMVEGGGAVLGAFFEQRLVDEVCVYMAPVDAGRGCVGIGVGRAHAWKQEVFVEEPRYTRLGKDWKMEARVSYVAARQEPQKLRAGGAR